MPSAEAEEARAAWRRQSDHHDQDAERGALVATANTEAPSTPAAGPRAEGGATAGEATEARRHSRRVPWPHELSFPGAAEACEGADAAAAQSGGKTFLHDLRTVRRPTAAAPMWHMNKNNSGPYIGRDRLYGGIQITEPRLLLGP